MDVSAAQQEHFIDNRDLNCAASYPIALYNPIRIGTSAIRINHKAVKEAGLQPHFDLIAFTIKIRGLVEPGSAVRIMLYKVEDGQAELLDGLYIGVFGDEASYQDSATYLPGDWWPGWGHGANFVEIEATAPDGEMLDICMDNVLLLFEKEEAS